MLLESDLDAELMIFDNLIDCEVVMVLLDALVAGTRRAIGSDETSRKTGDSGLTATVLKSASFCSRASLISLENSRACLPGL